ncbi:hypothetical protein [Desulfoscipio geothermicus]|uniref:Uncharacterized protein n=1 Tax=Desulfoscipio geothermicus DSM 3669 TaxID=1121426 RepID=A0A1I6EC20_9FIRM|nr:hypothetical protein [Desulfoscipio geothermicus]SFR15303.1 hypothetical protein SAMN05660706_13517 [Desulfoscipio geothermicus DSM 3669]
MSISCNCSVDLCDAEAPEFYREDFLTAKKAHKCTECGGEIKPGQRYRLVVGKWDRHLETFRTCMPCHRIGEDLCPQGYYIGGLVEIIQECLGFDYRKVPKEYL